MYNPFKFENGEDGVAVADGVANPFSFETQSRAKISLTAMSDISPEQELQARALSDQIGMPVNVARELPEQAQQIALSRRADELLNESPRLAKWLADEDNAMVTHDDVEGLVSIDRAIRNVQFMTDTPRATSGGFSQGIGRGLRGLGEFFLTNAEQLRERDDDTITINGIEFPKQSGDSEGEMFDERLSFFSDLQGGFLSSAGGALVGLGERISPPEERQDTVTDIADAVGQIGGYIATAYVSGGTGVTALGVGQGADIQAQRIDEQNDLNAQVEAFNSFLPVEDQLETLGYVTPDQQMLAMAAGGAVTAVTEKFALDKLLDRIPPKIKNQIVRKITDVAIAGGYEAAQEVVEGVGQNLVALGMYDPEAKIFVPEEAVQEAIAAGGAGAIVRAFITSIVPGRARQQEALDASQRLQELVDTAKESKTYKRSKEVLEKYLASVADGGRVFFQSEDLRALYESDEWIDDFGLSPEQVREADELGAPIELPVERYVTLSEGPQGEGLRQAVRAEPDGLSLAEAANEAVREALETEYNEAVVNETRGQEIIAGAEFVRSSVETQLVASGAAPEVAKTQSLLWKHFFGTLEAKGVDAKAAFERLGLRIQNPRQQGPRTDELDLLIDDLRAERIPSEREAYGESMADFARRLGVRDDRGDLAALDIDKERKPGQRNVLRDDGLSVDELGERALEAGFYQERPTVSQVLDDISESVRGNPVYALYNSEVGDGDVASRRDALLALDENIAEQGIDLDALDNAAVKSALGLGDGAQPDPDGRVLNQERRASVTFPADGVFSDKNVVVRLQEKADLSSFLHESGHIFLEMYSELAKESPEIAAELSSIRDWLGAEDKKPFTTEQHEKFAEGFETYLFEGRAPNPELRSAFAKFKAWLTRIYKDIRNMRIKLNPKAREIFDRMLATESAIELARYEERMNASEELKGLMSDKIADQYLRDINRAREQAEEKLLKETMKEIKARETSEYRSELKEVQERVAADVWSRPVYRAFWLLTRGEFRDGDTPDNLKGVKLNKETIIATRGQAVLNRLLRSRNRVYSESGIDPELIASSLNFRSGDEMIMALAQAGKPEDVIRDEVAGEMAFRHGDIAKDGTLEREAVEAVYNDPQGRVLQAEMDALAKRALQSSIPMAQIKATAVQVIERTRASDAIRPELYSRRALNLSKKALNLAAKGKYAEALRAKQQQILNFELARLAFKARHEVGQIDKFLTRVGPRRKLDPKKVNPEFIGKIRELLGLAGAQNPDASSMIDWADKVAVEYGYGVLLPVQLEVERRLNSREQMSLEQLRDLRGSVRSIYDVGRKLSEEATEQFKREMETLALSIENKAGAKHRVEPFDRKDKTKWGAIISAGERFTASLRKLPFLLRVLDGSPDGIGPMYRRIMLPLRQAGGVELELKAENQELIEAVIKKHNLDKDLAVSFWRELGVARFLGSRGVHSKILGTTITFEEVFAVALNLGNAGNEQRIGFDSRFGSPARARAVVDEFFEKRHWEAVQEIWDLVDSRWPQVAELEKRTTGVVPQKVEAVPVKTKFGTFKGGYYPLKYDPAYIDNKDITDQATEFDFKALVSGGFGRAATKNGHTVERATKVERPVWLSLGALTQHLDEVAHDLAYREAVGDAWRVLNNRRVGEAISNSINRANYEAMLDTVKRIAGGQLRPRGLVERTFRTLRVNAAAADLGLNIRSIMTQPLGVTQSMARLGNRVFARGVAEYAQNPVAGIEMAFEKSAFLRNRAKVITRDMRDVLSGENSRGKMNKIRAYAMLPMQAVDTVGVAVPTWIAAYRDHFERTGNEKESIVYADGVVADTQGSGLVMDLATLQSGSETEKLFTYMYGYFSTTFNLMFEAGQIAKKEPARAAYMASMLILIPGILAEFALSGLAGDEDDEARVLKTALLGVFNQATATTPGVREAAGALKFGRGQETFYGRLLSTSAQVVSNIGGAVQEGEMDAARAHNLVEASIRTVGLMFGIPGTGGLARAYDTYTQDDDPTIIEAVLTGKDSDN